MGCKIILLQLYLKKHSRYIQCVCRILSRCAANSKICRLISIPTLPSASDLDFEQPTEESIQALKKDQEHESPSDLKMRDKLWYPSNGRICIPPNSADLQRRLCIIEHTSSGGHLGREATELMLKNKFSSETVSEDDRLFVRACIHYKTHLLRFDYI